MTPPAPLSVGQPARPRLVFVALALLPAALLAAALAWSLSHRGRTEIDSPLARPDSTAVPHAVEIASARLPRGVKTAAVTLSTDRPEFLLQQEEIRLLFATYATNVDLVDGELRIDGTPCVFRTPAGETIRDNLPATFRRGDGCTVRVASGSGSVSLALRHRGTGRIALWTFAPPAGERPAGLLRLANPAGGSATYAVRGSTIVHVTTRITRLQLIAYVWELPAGRVRYLFVIAMALVAIGTLSAVAGTRPLPVSAGIGAIAAGLAASYAIAIPPFQAADEPLHFLAYARLARQHHVESEQLPAQADALARRTHYQRLRFDGDQRFRVADIGQPMETGLNERLADDLALRSSAGNFIWRLTRMAAGRWTASRQLLALRLLNALFFGAAFALAAFYLAKAGLQAAAVLPVLLAVPTLPLFAMQVSNYAPLTWWYVLLASAVAVAFADGRRSHWAGPALGLALGLAVTTSRSALPMVVVAGSVALVRAGLGTIAAGRAWRPAAIFWGGLGLGLGLAIAPADPDYWTLLRRADDPRLPLVPWLLRDLPWIVLLPCAAGMALEWWLAGVRQHVGGRPAHLLRSIVRWGAGAGVAVILGSLLASLWTPLPASMVLAAGQPRPADAEYFTRLLLSAATWPRLTGHDHLLTTTFWGGFGWLDRLLPDVMVAVLASGAAGAAGLLLLRTSRETAIRRGVWIAALATALFVTIAVYGAVSLPTQLNLHGRYLIGLYLAMLAALAAGLIDEGETRWAGLSAVLPGAVHAYALTFVISGYF